MSARLSLPHSQQRHSNIAVVRLTKGNKRIEIACYKNKVVAYRSGAETDINEVIQVDRVFSSVSRGEFASAIDIRHVIGEDMKERDAIKYILQHGDLQIASGERAMSQEEMLKDVCTIVAQKVVHPQTKRPYSALFLEEALRSIGASVRVDQPAKKQAMQFVKELCQRQIVPVMRAQMRVRVNTSAIPHLDDFGPTVVSSDDGEVLVDIDPEHFRAMNELCAAKGFSMTVIDYAVSDTSHGDASAFANTSAPTSPTAAQTAAEARRSKRDARRQARKNAHKDDESSSGSSD